jgi:hypothetical protein
MRKFQFHFLVLLLITGITGCVSSKKQNVVHLLQPENFYYYVQGFGVNNDPKKVFTWENGILRASGEHYGFAATKQTNFTNYRLVAEFKWGEKTWPPREHNTRDSGVLVHCVGSDPKIDANWIWPQSIEGQIIEGGTGDVLVVGGAYLTVNGKTLGPKTARFDRPGREPWKDVKGFRGPNEIEKPFGQWNKMEIICDGDRVCVSVNGHKTIDGTNASPRMGKILLQSEGAEIFFRRLDLYPLR